MWKVVCLGAGVAAAGLVVAGVALARAGMSRPGFCCLVLAATAAAVAVSAVEFHRRGLR